MSDEEKAEDGKVVAKFDNPEAVADPSGTHVTAYREVVDDQWVVQKGSKTYEYGSLEELREDWQDIYTPFIPENEFPRMPRDEDFTFVIFPDDGNEDYDEPMIYEQGELKPLFTDGQPTEDESRENEDEPGSRTEENPTPEQQESRERKDSESKGQTNGAQENNPGEDQYKCRNCGKMATVSVTEVSGRLACDSCGFTPDEDDERFDHLRNQDTETNVQSAGPSESQPPGHAGEGTDQQSEGGSENGDRGSVF